MAEVPFSLPDLGQGVIAATVVEGLASTKRRVRLIAATDEE